jgi:hypothetical protein
MDERTDGPSWVDETRSQRTGVRVAAADVQDALARPSFDREDEWRDQLRDRLDALANAFARHVDVAEAPEGVLQRVPSEEPRLAHRAERLRRDHAAIRDDIERVVFEVRPMHALDAGDIAEIRTLVDDLLRKISYHRYLGADLVYQAYDVDIEAAD